MDIGPDTSPARFGGQWAFLSSARSQNHGNTRSYPSSFTPRPDFTDSSLSHPIHPASPFSFSRSNVWRHGPTNSIGSNILTVPTQPVTVRAHSAIASRHQNPHAREGMGRRNELPPVSEFSIESIMTAIQPDIDGTIDAIAEIMGRNRLTLANEYDSHVPPQGEIRAGTHVSLLPVEEASSSNERLAADNVIIVPEDASLVEGSHSGSAAYGLLERLRAVPRPRRQRSDMPSSSVAGPSVLPYPRTISSPAAITDVTNFPSPTRTPKLAPRSSRALLNNGRRSTSNARAIVSETYLHAGSGNRITSNPPLVSEGGRTYPLYSYDESELFETPVPPQITTTRAPALTSFAARVQNLRFVSDLHGLATWLRNDDAANRRRGDAQAQLREILQRTSRTAVAAEEQEVPREPPEEAEMYD